MTTDEAARAQGFTEFGAVLALAAGGSYRPTFFTTPATKSRLQARRAEAGRICADAFDAEMAARGDARRAYRAGVR